MATKKLAVLVASCSSFNEIERFLIHIADIPSLSKTYIMDLLEMRRTKTPRYTDLLSICF